MLIFSSKSLIKLNLLSLMMSGQQLSRISDENVDITKICGVTLFLKSFCNIYSDTKVLYKINILFDVSFSY